MKFTIYTWVKVQIFQNPELLEFKFKNLNMLYANKSLNGQMFLDELKMKVLRRSPDLFYNVKIGQGQLLLIIKHVLFYHIWGFKPFWSSDLSKF